MQCNGAPPRLQQQEAARTEVQLGTAAAAGAPQAASNGSSSSQQPEADTLIEFRDVWKSFGRWAGGAVPTAYCIATSKQACLSGTAWPFLGG